MLSLHRPILTQQKSAPWSWVIMINLVWFVSLYTLFVTSVALPLTLVRFTEDTRIISFVTTVGQIVGIVIGPLCNYISDRLWTRWGRRRPFMLVGVAGTFLAMALTPYMPALVPLILLTVISSVLGDIAVTLEPLWLEIIPPEQRGRGFVVRTVSIQLSIVYFFQVMYAQWRNRYHLDFSAAGLGVWNVTGEERTYLAGAILQLYTIVLLFFLVREVHPEGVELHPWRELDLNPVRFAKDFILNVFGDRRWWPVYLFYITGTFMTAGVGTWANLMTVQQWKFDMQSLALMGLPRVIMDILIVAPLMGRQADKFTRYPRWLLGGIAAAGLGACWWIVRQTFPGLKPADLPPFPALTGISFSITLTGIALVFLLTQEFNRGTPTLNKRLWPWMLSMISGFVSSLGLLYFVRVHCGGQPPPISHWFLVGQFTLAFSGFLTLAGPLLYEFMPGDKIGTLSSGFGLLATALNSVMSVMMGFWVYYYSLLFAHNGQKDYSSYLLAIIVTGPISMGVMLYFYRLVKKGKIIEFGLLKLNSDGHPIQAGKPAEH